MAMSKTLLVLALAAGLLLGAEADRRKATRVALHGQAALRGPGAQQRPSSAAGDNAALLAVGDSSVDAGKDAEEGAASAEAIVAEAEKVAAHEEASLEAQAAGRADAGAGTSDGGSDEAAGSRKVARAAEKKKKAALQVKILRAKGLRFSDGKQLGISDPYCICEIPGKANAKVQTLAIDGLRGVHWNHQGEIEAYAPGDSLRCSVYERDAVEDNFLGRATLSSRQLLRGFKGELALSDAGAGVHAYLRLAVNRGAGSLTKVQEKDTESEEAEDDDEDTDSDDSEDGEDEADEDQDDDEGEKKSLDTKHLIAVKKKGHTKH